MDIFEIAVIPGDGIGTEVTGEAIRVVDAAAELDGGLRFKWASFPWSCEYYQKTGRMMPEDALSRLSGFNAILLGAVGHPSVADHVSLWGLLLPIRRGFQQYVNLRPCRLLKGITSPLRHIGPGGIDMMIVRENNEGEYSNMGGRLHSGTPYEIVMQNTVFTRMGTERIIKYAFELASKRRSYVAGATKSNGINYTMPFWDEVFGGIAGEYPGVRTALYHVDALAAYFVTKPETFDVVVGSNLFGDILSDLGAAVIGSIGIAPSGNINPEGKFPSMFEPVHGSAPDIVGKGIANPVGAIWSAQMMLEHLGKPALAAQVMDAMESVLGEGKVRTPDIGGRSSTREVTDAIIARLHG